MDALCSCFCFLLTFDIKSHYLCDCSESAWHIRGFLDPLLASFLRNLCLVQKSVSWDNFGVDGLAFHSESNGYMSPIRNRQRCLESWRCPSESHRSGWRVLRGNSRRTCLQPLPCRLEQGPCSAAHAPNRRQRPQCTYHCWCYVNVQGVCFYPCVHHSPPLCLSLYIYIYTHTPSAPKSLPNNFPQPIFPVM